MHLSAPKKSSEHVNSSIMLCTNSVGGSARPFRGPIDWYMQPVYARWYTAPCKVLREASSSYVSGPVCNTMLVALPLDRTVHSRLRLQSLRMIPVSPNQGGSNSLFAAANASMARGRYRCSQERVPRHGLSRKGCRYTKGRHSSREPTMMWLKLCVACEGRWRASSSWKISRGNLQAPFSSTCQ